MNVSARCLSVLPPLTFGPSIKKPRCLFPLSTSRPAPPFVIVNTHSVMAGLLDLLLPVLVPSEPPAESLSLSLAAESSLDLARLALSEGSSGRSLEKASGM